MPTLPRSQIVATILKHRVSAIIRTQDQQLAHDAIRAAVDGGFRVVEFTLTTPGAMDLIAEFAKEPQLLVGAGTVMTFEQARAARDAGASFLVSPVCDPMVVLETGQLGLVSMPGTFTPTEMVHAQRAGADFVKLFPAPANVAEYITAILLPLPTLRIFPTAGVTADNVVEVLKAGAAGAGFVRSLFTPQDMAARNFAAIKQRAADIISRVEKM